MATTSPTQQSMMAFIKASPAAAGAAAARVAKRGPDWTCKGCGSVHDPRIHECANCERNTAAGKHPLAEDEDDGAAGRASLVGNKKAKTEPAGGAEKTSSAPRSSSGWQLFQEEEKRAMEAAQMDCSISVRALLSPKFDYDIDELGEEEQEALANSLTLEQCRERVRAIHLREAAGKAVDKQLKQVSEDLIYADDRNERGDFMVMLNTWSSACMYPVIFKHVAKAQKAVNAATKACKQQSGGGSSSIANDAFVTALAVTKAVCDQEHWYQDTEDSEPCTAAAKKLSKLWSDLLLFTDEMLGLCPSTGRQAVLCMLEQINEDWDNYDYVDNFVLKHRSPRNKNGMGSPAFFVPAAAAAAKPPPASLAAAAAAAGGTAAAGPVMPAMARPLLTKRAQFYYQLRAEPEPASGLPEVAFVLSGANFADKLSQTVAYIFGAQPSFEYHSQKGKCVEQSRFIVGESAPICNKRTATQLGGSKDAPFLDHKKVKVAELFQGATLSATSGIVWDSAAAQSAADAVFFVAPGLPKIKIVAEVAVHKKLHLPKANLMPRVVRGLPDSKIRALNSRMNGDRQGPAGYFFNNVSQAEINGQMGKFQMKPLAGRDGQLAAPEVRDLPGGGSYTSSMWDFKAAKQLSY